MGVLRLVFFILMFTCHLICHPCLFTDLIHLSCLVLYLVSLLPQYDLHQPCTSCMARGAMIRSVSYETHIRVMWLWRGNKVCSLVLKGPISSTASTTKDAMILFKPNDHIVKDNATHDPVGHVLKVIFTLDWVPKLSKRLEATFKSSKCVFHPYTDLIRINIYKWM